MPKHHSPRDLAYAGLLGAAALLLPLLFHLFQLGRVFMPMYLPLLTLAFLVRPWPAMLTGIITPLLSAAVTGMPPFDPPVAASMSIEIGAMVGLLATLRSRWPAANEWLLLAFTLAVGRAIQLGLAYGFASLLSLPAGFLAGAWMLAGWPGMLLMLVTIPPIVRIVRRSTHRSLASSKEVSS
jgi:hypothetical protein